MTLTESIKDKAIGLGFDLVGVTGAEVLEGRHVEYLRGWLDGGSAGTMGYMHRNFEKRINPAELLDGAKSVICTAINYKPADSSSDESNCKVADFALYEDYHGFMKKLLRKLCGFIGGVYPGKFKYKICVDSAPLAERSLAERAGVGFIGRNHMLINPQLGSRILLGEIVTDIELEPDEPMVNHCPDCGKCIRACPTGAIGWDGSFDAKKCVSYLTIEHKGDVDSSLASRAGPYIFGCDRCIEACPYELNAPVCANSDFEFFPERQRLNAQEILDWEQGDFDRCFGGSAVHRTGLEKIKSNARVCIDN